MINTVQMFPRTETQDSFGTFTHGQPNTSALEIDTAGLGFTASSFQAKVGGWDELKPGAGYFERLQNVKLLQNGSHSSKSSLLGEARE